MLGEPQPQPLTLGALAAQNAHVTDPLKTGATPCAQSFASRLAISTSWHLDGLGMARPNLSGKGYHYV